MLATQRWRLMVEAEHAQSEGMKAAIPVSEDHWQPYAGQFRADPRRTDDPLVERLQRLVKPEHTVTDVGAGGGRLGLPLALRCRHVVAVEPSASMAAVLLEQAEQYGINNLSLVRARWEEAEVAVSDLVLCSHVVYTIREIGPFLRKLEAHARRQLVIVLYDAPPQSQLYPLWQRVHGHDRLPLPSLPQLKEVLRELAVDARIDLLQPQPPRGYDSRAQALEQLSRRLYLAAGSPQAKRLEEMLPGLLVEQDGVFRIRAARALRPALVWWRPDQAGPGDRADAG